MRNVSPNHSADRHDGPSLALELSPIVLLYLSNLLCIDVQLSVRFSYNGNEIT